MIRILISTLLLFSSHLLIGQEKYDNVKTEGHQNIAGTKLFIIPPEGFEPATSFQGFQEASTSSSILVLKIPGEFSAIEAGLTKEALKTQGVTMDSKAPLEINGQRGLFIRGRQSAYGTDFTKYILIFGLQGEVILMNGTFPEANTEMGPLIEASMLTTVAEEGLEVNPLESVAFKIDTEGTKLQFAKNISGGLLYTVDGKVPTLSPDKTSLTVALSVAEIAVSDKREYTINRMLRFPYDDIKIREGSVKKVEIDGISGFEAIADGKNKNDADDRLIYLVMLYPESGYYAILGSTNEKTPENLALFRTVANTFEKN